MSLDGGFAAPGGGQAQSETRTKEQLMGLLDKLTGRAKQAAGDVTGDPALRREGRQEERKGEAKEELAHQQDKVEEKAADVADLERRTS